MRNIDTLEILELLQQTEGGFLVKYSTNSEGGSCLSSSIGSCLMSQVLSNSDE